MCFNLCKDLDRQSGPAPFRNLRVRFHTDMKVMFYFKYNYKCVFNLRKDLGNLDIRKLAYAPQSHVLFIL